MATPFTTTTTTTPHKRTAATDNGLSWKDSLRSSCLKRARLLSNEKDIKEMLRNELQLQGVSVLLQNENGHNKELTEQEWLDLIEMVEREYEQEKVVMEQHNEPHEEEEYLLHLMANDTLDCCICCPICQQANLVQAKDSIVCPNLVNNNNNCSFEIHCPTISLQTLKEQITFVYEEHTASHCFGKLVFDMVVVPGEESMTALVATCHVCQQRYLPIQYCL